MGHDFHAAEAELRLAGWNRPRRVVVLRRQVKGNLAAEVNSSDQQTLHFIGHSDKIKPLLTVKLVCYLMSLFRQRVLKGAVQESPAFSNVSELLHHILVLLC